MAIKVVKIANSHTLALNQRCCFIVVEIILDFITFCKDRKFCDTYQSWRLKTHPNARKRLWMRQFDAYVDATVRSLQLHYSKQLTLVASRSRKSKPPPDRSLACLESYVDNFFGLFAARVVIEIESENYERHKTYLNMISWMKWVTIQNDRNPHSALTTSTSDHLLLCQRVAKRFV